MKLKLFISTAVLTGILAVSASAAVTGVGADGRDGAAVDAAAIKADQKSVLTVNAGDLFKFTVNDPGEYITVITYLENGELGNDTILYVNQYEQGTDYEAGAASKEISYKVRSGLANGIYRLEVNSGAETSEKLWYKLGRSDLVDENGNVSATYAKSAQFNNTFSAGYLAKYAGKNGNLSGVGFSINKKLDDGSLSGESLTREVDLSNITAEGDVSYGMTIYGATSLEDFASVVVTPYATYNNLPTDAQ